MSYEKPTVEEMQIYLLDLYRVRHGFFLDDGDKRCESTKCNALYEAIRSLISQPRTVTQEQVDAVIEKYSYVIEGDELIFPKEIPAFLADLGIKVEGK